MSENHPDITIGRVVHYRLEAGRKKGELRPAIVTYVWNAHCVNLQVFTDPNDDLPCPYGVRSCAAGGSEREWRWPEISTGANPGETAAILESVDAP